MHHCTEININSFCYNITKISFTYRDSQRTVEVCVPTQYLLYLPITSHIYIAHKSVERINLRGESILLEVAEPNLGICWPTYFSPV